MSQVGDARGEGARTDRDRRKRVEHGHGVSGKPRGHDQPKINAEGWRADDRQRHDSGKPARARRLSLRLKHVDTFGASVLRAVRLEGV